MCYFGPAAGALSYFSKLGYVCPMHENPADYFIDLLTADVRDMEGSQQRIADIQENFKPTPLNDDSAPLSPDYDGVAKWLKSKKSSNVECFLWLFDRSLKSIRRDNQFIAIRTVQTLVIAIALSILYWQIDTNQKSISDRNGLLIISIINNSFNEVMAVLGVFPVERPVFYRERASNTYSVLSYYMAKQFAELPAQIIFPTLFSVIVYWCAGLQ